MLSEEYLQYCPQPAPDYIPSLDSLSVPGGRPLGRCWGTLWRHEVARPAPAQEEACCCCQLRAALLLRYLVNQQTFINMLL